LKNDEKLMNEKWDYPSMILHLRQFFNGFFPKCHARRHFELQNAETGKIAQKVEGIFYINIL